MTKTIRCLLAGAGGDPPGRCHSRFWDRLLEEFSDKDTARIFIAQDMKQAGRVEQLLTENGIDYAINVEPFSQYIPFLAPAQYMGAAFYVLSGQGAFCRNLLRAQGLSAGVVDDG